MTKQKVTVTFDFDKESGEVSNVRSSLKEVTKKASTTTKKSKKKEEDTDPVPRATREENKIVLNAKAIELLQIEAGDKVEIKYKEVKKGSDEKIPIIGASSVFNDEQGNKLTKAGSVTCRGKANTVLSSYGTNFILVPMTGTDGNVLCKLKKEDSVDKIAEAENTKPELITNDKEEVEVSTDDDEDLPF